jgi:para-aminobenzoate synthetase component 1
LGFSTSVFSATDDIIRQVAMPADHEGVRRRLLAWLSRFPYASWLDSCGTDIDRYGRYQWLAGAATAQAPRLTLWRDLPSAAGRWWLGALPYELKNRLEPQLHSQHAPLVAWPELAMFAPEILIEWPHQSHLLQLRSHDPCWLDQAEALIMGDDQPASPLATPPPLFRAQLDRDQYLRLIERLQAHIREGDFYEINLAQAYLADYQLADPATTFLDLLDISPVPFGAFLRFDQRYLLCASPERFLQLHQGQLCSQPIKGTAPRGATPAEDEAHRAYLSHSEKEQAENVMIVDLTRNDLHRSCETGSVSVPYLFDIQAFPQVFQLVSSVIGRKRSDVPWHQALAHAFPPGSMTGAPKVKTLEMIDHYEPVARGLYAGSVGYLSPAGEFDFNVVIRSLIYDAARAQLSYHVGGAITYDSDPAQEYEETLIKARAIRRLFQSDEGER